MKANSAMNEEMQLLHAAVNVLLKARRSAQTAASDYRRARSRSRSLWDYGHHLDQLDATLVQATQRKANAETELLALWDGLEIGANRLASGLPFRYFLATR